MSRSTLFRRQRSGKAGMTLVEILVVIAVLLIIALIGTPLTIRALARLRVESFTDNVGVMVQRMRSEAIRKNAEYTIDWNGDRIESNGPGLSSVLFLDAPASGLTRFAGAPCLDYDGDGVDELVDPPLSFDGIGAPSGLVAFCFTDPTRASSGKSNVMQIRIDSTAGVVKVGKLIDDSTVSAGERFADEATEKHLWEWY